MHLLHDIAQLATFSQRIFVFYKKCVSTAVDNMWMNMIQRTSLINIDPPHISCVLLICSVVSAYIVYIVHIVEIVYTVYILSVYIVYILYIL